MTVSKRLPFVLFPCPVPLRWLPPHYCASRYCLVAAAKDAVEQQLNNFVQLEASVRHAEQAEIIASLEKDVLTTLSGKVRFAS